MNEVHDMMISGPGKLVCEGATKIMNEVHDMMITESSKLACEGATRIIIERKGVFSMEKIQDVLALFAQEARRLMGESYRKLLVYGSYARGDYHENSDVDIMILTSLPENQIERVEDALYDEAFTLFMEYGVQISVIVKNEDQFNYWLGAVPFYNNVKREGVEFVG